MTWTPEGSCGWSVGVEESEVGLHEKKKNHFFLVEETLVLLFLCVHEQLTLR